RRASRVTTEVRCRGGQPWKLYVPVRLAVFQPVVIATRALPRDSLLTGDDISLAEADIGGLDYGFLSDPANAIGHRLRRPLAAGDVLTPANLETPALIQRGQRVTLEARSGGLTVRMAGVAKADGIRGQIIEVENLGSGRDVQAIVRSAKAVEVLLQ
nr:flagellar basal body P-ring formation chaperone FlgA [Gammaproteobacteria bacterium]